MFREKVFDFGFDRVGRFVFADTAVGQDGKAVRGQVRVGLGFIEHARATRRGRADERNLVIFQKFLQIAVFAELAVDGGEDQIDLAASGDEFVLCHRLRGVLKLKIEIGRRVGVKLALREAVEVFLCVAIDGDDVPAQRGQVIHDRTRRVQGYAPLRRWPATNDRYAHSTILLICRNITLKKGKGKGNR